MDSIEKVLSDLEWNISVSHAENLNLILELKRMRFTKIKPLTWVLEEDGNYCAHSILGDFSVNQIGTAWLPDSNCRHFGNIEQAKNYCNEWYTKTIEKALE